MGYISYYCLEKYISCTHLNTQLEVIHADSEECGGEERTIRSPRGYGSCMICGWCIALGHEGRKPSGCLADAVSTVTRPENNVGHWCVFALLFWPILLQFFQPSVTHRVWQTICRMHVVRHWVNVCKICKHTLQMDLLYVFPFFWEKTKKPKTFFLM